MGGVGGGVAGAEGQGDLAVDEVFGEGKIFGAVAGEGFRRGGETILGHGGVPAPGTEGVGGGVVGDAVLEGVAAVVGVGAGAGEAVDAAGGEGGAGGIGLGGGGHGGIKFEAPVAGGIGLRAPGPVGEVGGGGEDLVAEGADVGAGGVEAAELGEGDGGGELAHAGVAAIEGHGLPGRGEGLVDGAVLAEVGAAHGAFVSAEVAGGDEAAFAGGHGLVVLKTEDGGVAPSAEAAPAVGGTGGFGDVFEDVEAAAVGVVDNRVKVGGDALEVNDEHGAGAGRGEAGNLGGVEAKGAVDLGEDGAGAGAHDGGEAGEPAPGGHDDFVAGADAPGGEDKLEGGGTAGDGEGVGHAEPGGELALEGGDHGRRRLRGIVAVMAEELAATEDVEDEGFFFSADEGGAETEGRGGGHGKNDE